MCEADEQLTKHDDAEGVGASTSIFDPVASENEAGGNSDRKLRAMLVQCPERQWCGCDECEEEGCREPIDDAFCGVEVGCGSVRDGSEDDPVP